MEKRTSVLAGICLVIVTMCACGGGGDNCAEPQAEISGDWRITEISTENTCDEGPSSPYTLKITQSGTDLIVSSPDLSKKFSGKICGASIHWEGSYPEDGGTMVLKPVNATLSGNSISGTKEWQWGDGTDGCSGTTRFSGTRQ